MQVLALVDIFPDISGILQSDRSKTVKAKNELTEAYEVVAFKPFTSVGGSLNLNWSAVNSVDLAMLDWK